MEMRMSFFRTDELPATEMLPGVTRRAAYLEGVMLTFFDFEPHSIIPVHHHPNQQITWVVSGAMEFDLNGEKRVLHAGEGVLIPPDTPHGAAILGEPCRTLDAWHPIRDDYR
jgi:quercetin dioxygenase-like cupin family protein